MTIEKCKNLPVVRMENVFSQLSRRKNKNKEMRKISNGKSFYQTPLDIVTKKKHKKLWWTKNIFMENITIG